MLFGYMEDRKIITGIITNPGTNQSISRRDIENISGMAVIVCEGKVSRGVYNDALLLTNNATGYVVGKAEIIKIEEES